MVRCTSICCVFLVTYLCSIECTKAQEFLIDNGMLKLVDDISVPAEVSGTIEKMLVTEGEFVKAGNVIAEIESASVQLAIEAAKLELETANREAKNEIDILEAQKSEAVAKAELDRVVSANAKTPNTFLNGEVDRFRLMFERAELGVRRAQHEQELAKLAAQRAKGKLDAVLENLSHYQISAPCSGMVVTVSSHSGEWVEPGQTVVQIVGTSRLRIDGFVNADQANVGLIGKKVHIHFAESGKDSKLEEQPSVTDRPALSGRITFVSPEMNPVDSTIKIMVEFENPGDRFLAGSRVSPRITVLGGGDS